VRKREKKMGMGMMDVVIVMMKIDDDDDEIDGAVFFGDADETREF